MADDGVETKAPQKRVIGRPIQPGQVLNPKGRPKGSRHKLGEQFVQALQADFQEHGPEAIVRVRDEQPAAYLRVIASLMPKQIEIKEGAFDGVSDEELAALVVAARSALGVAGGGGSGTLVAEGPQSVN